MKKALLITLVICLAVTGIALAAVNGSKHDLGGNGQVCVFCHHPHRGSATGVSNDLLWNISDVSATYATYATTDTTIATVGGNADKPQTLLCMGCHDGQLTTNTFVRGTNDSVTTITSGATIGTAIASLDTEANLGTTLVDDHPVAFTYSTLDAKAGDLRTATSGGDSGWQVVGSGSYPLYGGTDANTGTMECATCHDVHKGAPVSGLEFMRGDVANSQICTDCHTAK